MNEAENIIQKKRKFELSKDLVSFLIQILIVIIGATIAFWLDDMRINRDSNKNVVKVLKYLVEELESNKKELSETVMHQDSIIADYKKDTTKTNFNYSKPVLKLSGIKLAEVSGVLAQIDPKISSEIIECYAIQNEIQKIEDKIMNFLLGTIENYYNNNESQKEIKKSIKIYLSFLSEGTRGEKVLIESYEETIEKINGYLKK